MCRRHAAQTRSQTYWDNYSPSAAENEKKTYISHELCRDTPHLTAKKGSDAKSVDSVHSLLKHTPLCEQKHNKETNLKGTYFSAWAQKVLPL